MSYKFLSSSNTCTKLCGGHKKAILMWKQFLFNTKNICTFSVHGTQDTIVDTILQEHTWMYDYDIKMQVVLILQKKKKKTPLFHKVSPVTASTCQKKKPHDGSGEYIQVKADSTCILRRLISKYARHYSKPVPLVNTFSVPFLEQA